MIRDILISLAASVGVLAAVLVIGTVIVGLVKR